MSRMTKFLRQRCQLEQYLIEDGVPKLNMFGELQYQPPIELKCRHEIAHKDIQTANGSTVKCMSVYYVDEAVPILVDYRLDGHVVLSVISYVNALGNLEGYEVYV